MGLVEMRTATITEKGQISIPKEIRGIEGFKVGSKLAVLAFEDRIELRPLENVSERFSTALASEKSLAKGWLNKKEDKAWKNL